MTTPTEHLTQELLELAEHAEAELIRLEFHLNTLASLTMVADPSASGRVDMLSLSGVLSILADSTRHLKGDQSLVMAMLRDLRKGNANAQVQP